VADYMSFPEELMPDNPDRIKSKGITANYFINEEVRLLLPGMDGVRKLSIEQAKELHRQLAEILYGSQDTPKKVR
jgi:hypothetical protein